MASAPAFERHDPCPLCGHQPTGRNDWPSSDVIRLREWWTKGLSGGQIVRKFGGTYSRSAILGKVCRLGLQRWRR